MFFELFVARRHLLPHRGRIFLSFITVITILAVIVGVMALIVVLAVMNGFEREVKDRIIGTNPHVVLLRYGSEGVAGADSLAGRVRRVPDVVAVAPFVYGKAMMTARGQADGAVIKGIVTAREDSVTEIARYIETVPGAPPLVPPPGEPPGIFLGVHLAARMQLSIGERVRLLSPNLSAPTPMGFVPKVRTFVLSGLFRSGMYEYDDGMAFIDIAQAQEFFGLGDRVTGLGVKVTDPYRAPEIAERILSAVGPFPYRTNDWIGLNETLFHWMQMEKVVMFVILGLIILVAAFNIASVQIMLVKVKRREIGILKSMGAGRWLLLRLFVLQGVVIGVIGMVAGTILGVALCWLHERFELVKIPGDIYFIDTLPVHVQIGDILLVELAVLVLSALATLFPALWASTFDPVEAIRHD